MDAYSILVGPSTIADYAMSTECYKDVIRIISKLEYDKYASTVLTYIQEGLARFGNFWKYADITTILYAATKLLEPANYLEIGVRRGRSLAIVGALRQYCSIVGFDKWKENYAGMPNPGAKFVRSEMEKVGHCGVLELISEDSHEILSEYLKEHGAFFDIITVDGDRSAMGAEKDLHDVLPWLKVGGAVIFDDISLVQDLEHVWDSVVGSDFKFASWKFKELGYGVAFAVRKEA